MARIKKSSIAELQERIDSKALVENYAKLERRGDKWWGCCPFHGESTPSFNLDAQRGVFYCFGCGKGGSIITFIMEIEKLSFVEAVEFIAKKVGFRLEYEEAGFKDDKKDDKDEIKNLYAKIANLFHNILKNPSQGRQAYEYLKMRGITDEIIDRFQLGYAPKNRRWLHSFLMKKSYNASFLAKTGLFSQKYPNVAFFSDRIMFPICDRYGSPIAFGGRALREEGPKYLNSKDMEQYKKGETLFAFSYALKEIREKKAVVLCEGYMDVIAYHQAGIGYAVAPLGTALTEAQAQYLRNLCDVFYISFDSDRAGQKATERAILMLRKIEAEVYVVNMKNEKDPADILKNDGADALSLLVKNAIIDLDYLLLVTSERFSHSNSKMSAVISLFPYIASLSSSVMREEVVRKLSVFFHVREASILSDYDRFLKGGERLLSRQTPGDKKALHPAINMKELRILLTVVADRKLFVMLRSQVRSEDFDSRIARELYIALEECFREGKEAFSELLEKIDNEELKNIVTKAMAGDEFVDNHENILNDGIKLIQLNKLKRRRSALVNKINMFTLKGSDGKEMRDLLLEKSELDAQILEYNKSVREMQD